MKKISILGGGAMGSAIIRGLIESGVAMATDISVYDIDIRRLNHLVAEYGIRCVADLIQLVDPQTDILVLAIKPQNMEAALRLLKPLVNDQMLVISIAAGVSTGFILEKLGENIRLIRSMPNAAAMVGQSATALCKAGTASDDDAKMAVDFFSCIGQVVLVEEKFMNAVTALSGSGPGYIFTIMEALVDGGVLAGLPRDVARNLVTQTLIGAATMALDHGMSFSYLKDQITSPAGTTISGLKVMERAGIRGILMEAVESAKKRADELM